MDKRSFRQRLEALEQRSGLEVWAWGYANADWTPPGAPPVGHVQICNRDGRIMPLEEFQARYPRGTVVKIVYVTDWRGEDRHDG